MITQLAEILDTIALDEIGMKEQIKAKIASHNEFQESALGKKSTCVKVKEVDIRNYAKHILKNRPIEEKRELLSNLKSRLVLAHREIKLL